MLYYNPALSSQKAQWWRDLLSSKPDVEELEAALPKDYNQVCLVVGHVTNSMELNTIESAIQKEFPQKAAKEFLDVEIITYQK